MSVGHHTKRGLLTGGHSGDGVVGEVFVLFLLGIVGCFCAFGCLLLGEGDCDEELDVVISALTAGRQRWKLAAGAGLLFGVIVFALVLRT